MGSDGTPAGTRVAVDLTAQLGVRSGTEVGLVVIGGKLAILRGTAILGGAFLVSSDGTPSGTFLAWTGANLESGGFIVRTEQFGIFVHSESAGSVRTISAWNGVAFVPLPLPAFSRVGGIGVVGNLALYQTNNGLLQIHQMWRSDGTVAGTYVIGAAAPGATNAVCSWKRGAAFTVANAGGTSVWTTDGTAANTIALIDPPINYGSLSVSRVGDALVIGVKSYGAVTYWKNTTGATNDNQLVGQVVAHSTELGFDRGAAISDSKMLVELGVVGSGGEPWVLDMVANSLHQVAEVLPGPGGSCSAISPMVHGDRCRFLPLSLDDGIHGSELWVSDGTSANTRLVADLAPGSASASPTGFVRIGNQIFFMTRTGSLGATIWRIPTADIGANGVDDLGGGCAIPSGSVPLLDPLRTEAVLGLPCTLALGSAPPNASAIFVLSADARAVTLWNVCALHLGSGHAEWSATTDSTGRLTQWFPVPTVPELLGAKLTVQCGVITSPQSAVLSNALQLVFGLP